MLLMLLMLMLMVDKSSKVWVYQLCQRLGSIETVPTVGGGGWEAHQGRSQYSLSKASTGRGKMVEGVKGGGGGRGG